MKPASLLTFAGGGGGDFTEPIPNLYVVRVSAPGVILGQVEDELRSHGVAALRHAEHVEGGRVGERHVAQLRAGDVHAPRGICGRKEEEAYLCANLRRLFALYNTYHRSSFPSVSPNFSSSHSRFHCPMNFPIIAARYAPPPLFRHSILYWSLPARSFVANYVVDLRYDVIIEGKSRRSVTTGYD